MSTSLYFSFWLTFVFPKKGFSMRKLIFRLVSLFSVVCLSFFMIANIATALPIFHGPTPYLSFDDSPFKNLTFDQFHLETFEDGALNTPGVTIVNNKPGGGAVGVVGPSLITDSVDADDGLIDGLGQGGHVFTTLINEGFEDDGLTITFLDSVLGNFPTHVGVVWTDGSQTAATLFEAFDVVGNSLGSIGPVQIGGNSFLGTTGEDSFFGVSNTDGISKFVIRDPGGVNAIEIDHLQYGIQSSTPVPEPATIALLGIGLVGLACAEVRRRRKKKAVDKAQGPVLVNKVKGSVKGSSLPMTYLERWTGFALLLLQFLLLTPYLSNQVCP